jgi:hypothetical protein
MALSIQNRQFFSEQHVSPNTFLLSNASKLITERFDIISNFDFTSSVNEQVMFNSENSLKLLNGGAWNTLLSGDTVELNGIAQNGQGVTLTFISESRTVSGVVGDTVTFTTNLYTSTSSSDDFAGVIMPIQGQSQALTIINTTRNSPETIDIFHNLVLNNSQHNDNSLIDGEVNRFRVSGVDTLALFDTEDFTQLGYKSGGRYAGTQTIERIDDSGSNKVFRVELQYLLPSYSDSDLDVPLWYDAQQCLRPSFKVLGYPELNNPNSEIVFVSSDLEANTGFFNESYNQGVNDFNIDSVTITDSTGSVITQIDPNQTCTIEAVISSSSDFNDFVEAIFEVVPPESDFKNNPLSNLNNSYTSYFSKDGLSAVNTQVYAKNSGEVTTSNQSITTATNEITVSFDINPNAEFANYINSLSESDRLYRISLAVESIGGTTNNNNSVTLVISEGELTAAPIPDSPFEGVRLSEFYNHAQDISSGFGESSYNGRTEDDFVYKAILDMPDNIAYEQLKIQVEVVRDLDGTSFDLYSTALGFSNVPIISGVQQFNESQQVNQQLDGAGRNVISLINTGGTGAGTYETELVVSLMANWRDWLSNNQAFVDFYDINLPKNGQSQEWVRYLELSGFSIRLRCRFIKSSIAYYFGGGILLDDYDQNFDGITTITYFDENNSQVSALINGQIMTVRADHVLSSGSWDALNTWGWMSQRGFESDPRKQISTVWDWTSQNAPLKPKTGETAATLEVVTTNNANDTARVECLVDLTGGASEENSIIARIQSPVSPDCVSPIDYLLDLALANSENETDIPILIDKYLENGIEPSNICCPDCEVTELPSGDQFLLYSFGTNALITSLLATLDGDTVCCIDEYGIQDNCEVGFDAIWDGFMLALTGNTLALTNSIPSQLNTYLGVDLQALSTKVQSVTTDGSIRYDIVFNILSRGIKVICDNGVKTISGI